VSDFFSDAWGVYVAIATIASIAACWLLTKTLSTRPAPNTKVDTTGHVWDEDLAEWNNPLPRWWIWLFYLTIIFSVVYLVLYPGLGAFRGTLDWTSTGAYQKEQARAAAVYGPAVNQYLEQDVKQVAANPQAREMGQRLFLNYCSGCHGSDAGGSRGFPSLRAGAWLYGGEPEAIKASIADGRNGMMPPMAAAVGSEEDVKDVAHYVLGMSGRAHEAVRAQRGKEKFASACAACHGAEGKGNAQIGAPDLTDDVWLHSGSEAGIIETITKGRRSMMPAHKDLLDDGKIHLLTAYVYALPNAKP
jgi:cytochrome c oxidase cbb3-type subunit 3